MTSFLTLWRNRNELVLSEYFTAANNAETSRMAEWDASKKIQSAWRGHRVRKEMHKLNDAAVEIQRTWRGVLGRLLYLAALKEKNRKERVAFFNKCAIAVQRIWRGHHVRKTNDYYKRKAYLEGIKKRGDRLREDLHARFVVESEVVKREEQEKNEQKFREQTAKLHYLVSTSNIKGVFSPNRDKMASVFVKDQHIEEHIKLNGIESVKRGNEKYFSFSSQGQRTKSPEKPHLLPPISPNKDGARKSVKTR